MSATLASVLLVFLVVSLTQPHLLVSRAAKPRLTHLLDSRAVKPRHTRLLDSRAATVRRPSSSLTIPYQCWTSTRPLLEVTTYLATRILLSTSSSMATMTGLDKLELFNPHLETFERYVQRVKIYFAANGVREERKKFVFLNSLGVKYFNLLANLLSPDDPTTKTFDELVEILDKHFRPTTSVVAERYRLNCRRQRENESIADFVADLKRLIVPCKYPADTQDMILRDRFVFGLLSESTRKRLLTEKDDTTFPRQSRLHHPWRQLPFMLSRWDLLRARLDSETSLFSVLQRSLLSATDVEVLIWLTSVVILLQNAGHVPKLVTLPRSVEASMQCVRTLLSFATPVLVNRNPSLPVELTLWKKTSLVRMEFHLIVRILC